MTYKILGQVAPESYSDEVVYTVPDGKSTVVSTISVCTVGGDSALYRIGVVPAGELQPIVPYEVSALDQKNYVVYNAQLPPFSTDYHTLGITLGPGDCIVVHSDGEGVAFNVFGEEA